jgi:hypothetical protein
LAPAGQFSVEDTRRLFTVVVDEAIKRLQPGQDQFVGIVDLQGFSTSNIDLSFATFVIDAFLAMYPGRWVCGWLLWRGGGDVCNY